MAVVEGQRNGKFNQNGKLDHLCVRVTKSRLYESRVRDHVKHLGLNVSSSAIIVGAWSKVVMLWLQFECYY